MRGGCETASKSSTTREGWAIGRAVAAVLFGSLVFLANVGAAHAESSFVLVETEARAGDIVHFSITGAGGPFTYELDIRNHDIVKDASGTGGVLTGEFTLPHLGDSPRTVTVHAKIRESRSRSSVNAKLRYLGPALAVTPTSPEPAPDPIAEQPAMQPLAPAPGSVEPAAVPAPGPAPATLQTTTPPASPIHATRPRSGHGAAQKGTGVRSETRSDGGKHARRAARRKTRAARTKPRTAPLFDGVPEPGAGDHAPGDEDGYASLNARLPATALLSGVRVGSHGAAPSAAVIVPGLMAVAALALAGTAMHRRRRAL